MRKFMNVDGPSEGGGAAEETPPATPTPETPEETPAASPEIAPATEEAPVSE